jgi:cytoskeleton protein RodZ
VKEGTVGVPTLGETLRQARVAKKAKLGQVEAETRIERARLEALESDDLASLPDDVYTKGAIRNYALYLGLDPDQTLALYRKVRPAAMATRPLSQVAVTTRLTPLTYVTASLLLTILIVVGLFVTHVL